MVFTLWRIEASLAGNSLQPPVAIAYCLSGNVKYKRNNSLAVLIAVAIFEKISRVFPLRLIADEAAFARGNWLKFVITGWLTKKAPG